MTLNRFVARCGRPSVIYTDNGKNFVGTKSTLKDIVAFLKTKIVANKEFALNNGFEWKFIPSHSPHFGGLWESCVKCAKHHLKRVVGNVALTFEEFATLLTQVESILNLRPLSAVLLDLSSLALALPEKDSSLVSPGRLLRYEHLQQMTQHFWSRWWTEYIGKLQRRTKWKKNLSELKLNSMVLLKQDGLPPLKRKIGRVIEVFRGKDGISRVASVRTVTGTFRRSFANLCLLPNVNVCN